MVTANGTYHRMCTGQRFIFTLQPHGVTNDKRTRIRRIWILLGKPRSLSVILHSWSIYLLCTALEHISCHSCVYTPLSLSCTPGCLYCLLTHTFDFVCPELFCLVGHGTCLAFLSHGEGVAFPARVCLQPQSTESGSRSHVPYLRQPVSRDNTPT